MKYIGALFILALCVIHEIRNETQVKSYYNQNKYNISVERLEITYFNKDFIEYADLKSERASRKMITASGCLKILKDLPHITIEYHCLKQINGNKYVFTGIRLKADADELYEKNMLGSRKIVLEHSNLTLPVKKGVYCLRQAAFDSTQFPPMIPGGRYLINATVSVGDIKAVEVHIYVSITYSQLYKGPQ